MNPLSFDDWKENIQYSDVFIWYLRSYLGLTVEQAKSQRSHYLEVEYQSYSDYVNSLNGRYGRM